ncbi:hypothetical protein MKK88_13635 [Methylobacterium sp. E-005]|uniref:hypothetical protein n=1 Tax=Methylobacterium sp. E-005 TaxID=2836549 RepID=UPI001FB8B456|nr:hypothetical protein [Methylobacterium sp. E-005]MCJ2087022.1 hypothetical protein [Methylobacterium sp. E-005]
MARDLSVDAGDPAQERVAAERAGRKRLGENGRPRTVSTPAEQDAADRTAVRATGQPDPNTRPREEAARGSDHRAGFPKG